jgi:integrase/recombinase XerD
MSVTTAIILDKRRMIKKTNSFPVCIRVTHNRDYRRFPIGQGMTEKDFNKLSAPNLGEKLREVKDKLEKQRQRADAIIKNLRKFSFEAFRDEFSAFHAASRKRSVRPDVVKPLELLTTRLCDGHKLNNNSRQFSINQFGPRKYPRNKSEIDFRSLGELALYYGKHIIKLEAQERIGTVSCYLSSLTSLLDYRPQLRFSDITELELYKYEKWMKEKGSSVTTIGMYLRCLRHIFRAAISKKIISQDDYPFGAEAYRIPTAKNIKKAINIEDIQRIYEYCSVNVTEMMCKDFWFFIYLGNGMNVKDLALLKYGDIDGSFIRFIRAKTIHTTRHDPEIISVYCTDEIKDFIKKWGNPDKNSKNYIFPILEPGLDAYGRRHKIQLFTHLINEKMLSIQQALGLGSKITTMTARHSFATQLKRSGLSPEAIRELLGHKDLKTTMNYLASFDDETKAKQAQNLLPFKGNLNSSKKVIDTPCYQDLELSQAEKCYPFKPGL